MSKVLCRDCIHYDHIIHACARLDREAGEFVSYVFDECWCTTEEGARAMTPQESFLKYGPYWRAQRNMEDEEMDEEIEARFAYYEPKDGQEEKYHCIRCEAKDLALTIRDLCPDSREKSLALTKVEEAAMWANKAIARRG